MACDGCDLATLHDNFHDNAASTKLPAVETSWGSGGAVACSSGGELRLRHSSFTDNSAERRGGAVAVEQCSAFVDTTRMVANAVDFVSAHAAANPGAAVTLATVRSHEVGGGAVYVEHDVINGRTRGQRVSITSSVIGGNTAVLGGGFYAVSDADNSTCTSAPWMCAQGRVNGTLALTSVTWTNDGEPNVAGKNGTDVYVGAGEWQRLHLR